MRPLSVSVVIPTRGDVDLSAILASYEGVVDEVLVWDNSKRENLAVYARYALIAEARNELIMTQDDDVLHTPEGIQQIANDHVLHANDRRLGIPPLFVTCNMPANFRAVSFYAEHSLVGFGACFHRDLPESVFERFWDQACEEDLLQKDALRAGSFFQRTCDIVFTSLTPRILVDVLYEDMPWASADNRMWTQPTHREERQRMLDLCLKVRDAL